MGKRARRGRSRSSSSSSTSSASSYGSTERYRKRKGNKYRSDKNRSYTPMPTENANSKIERLERMVEELSQKNAILNKQQEVKLLVKSDCIPEFAPDNRSLTATQWLDKIEQLKQVNGWNDVTTIYHMQAR